MSKADVAIIISQKQVKSVVSSEPLKFICIDYDIEGLDEESLTAVYKIKGKAKKAFLSEIHSYGLEPLKRQLGAEEAQELRNSIGTNHFYRAVELGLLSASEGLTRDAVKDADFLSLIHMTTTSNSYFNIKVSGLLEHSWFFGFDQFSEVLEIIKQSKDDTNF